MVLIDHPQQQEVPQDGPSAAPPSGPRHAASSTRSASRFGRRHRWPVLAAAAALGVLVVPPSSPHQLQGAVANAADNSNAQSPLGPAATISFLSSGAPTGAMVLASAPTQVGDQAPIAPTVITGLAANGIPNVALNAYRVAATRMDNSSPSCGIDWSLLAGIGRVESDHGRYGGAVLNADGTSTPKILGPALNGGQFAFIRDTDGGAIDGDPNVDRAVGPMQFIPSTWKAYGADADAAGLGDPFNINDAALAAAHYLCVAGGNLRTDSGQRQAVMAYNHSDSYVNEVLALAHAYANGIPVADIPMVGDTSAPVPAVGTFGSPRYANGPANPGPAMGAQDMTPPNGPTTGASPNGGQPQGSSSAAPANSSGGTPPANSGTGTTGAAPATPAPAAAPAPSNPPANSGSSPLPATPKLPGSAPPVTNPLPPVTNQLPPAPAAPAPTPPLVDGQTCTHLNPLTGLKVLPLLPLCSG